MTDSISASEPAVWFPTIRAGTGVDVFTERLAGALEKRNIRTEITWLPHQAEFAPWFVRAPPPPRWANLVHINSWLDRKFWSGLIPSVVTLHSCVHDPAFSPYKSASQAVYHRIWVKPKEAEALRRASAVTAVSKYTGAQAEKIFGCRGIEPIHNWIDVDSFPYGDRPGMFEPFRLLFVGNMNRRKGADLLLPIMRKLGSGFELRYTGTESEARKFGATSANMVSLGKIRSTELLVKAYHDCDALLFPTRLEGLSLVALEAQACGRPLITSSSSSMPEVVVQGKTGILCPTDRVDDFVAAARRLKAEPGLWRTMCEGARRWVAERFSEEVMVDRFIALYADTISGRRTPQR